MGLDCYIEARKRDGTGDKAVASRLHKSEDIEVAYWRKNYPLNNWMHGKAMDTDPSDFPEYFPVGTTVRLRKEDVDALSAASLIEDAGTLAALREHLDAGRILVYWSG